MYGLLLLAATPGVVATDELAYFGKYRSATEIQATERVSLATLQGLLVLRAGTDRPELSLDTVTAQVPQAGTAQVPQFQVAPARRDAPGESVDFDLPVADFGNFRLSVLLQPSAALSAWALSGTLELVRDGSAQLAAAIPELRILELYGSERRYLAFEASVKRKRTPEAALAFRWRI